MPSQPVKLVVMDSSDLLITSGVTNRCVNETEAPIDSVSDMPFTQSISVRRANLAQQSLGTERPPITITPLAVLGLLVGVTVVLLVIWALWMLPMAGVALGALAFFKALGLALVSLLLQLVLAVAVTFPITSKIEQMGARFRPAYRIILTVALVLGVLAAISVGALVSLAGLGAVFSVGRWLLLTTTANFVMFVLILAVWLFILIFFTRSTRLKRKLEQKFNFRV
jgi:hypothetical protein